jgi:hypothetical protein
VGDPAGVEREVSRVLATPLPEVLNAFEPLSGLGKLQHSVVVVDLVGDVLIRCGIGPVAFELGANRRVVHVKPPVADAPTLE